MNARKKIQKMFDILTKNGYPALAVHIVECNLIAVCEKNDQAEKWSDIFAKMGKSISIVEKIHNNTKVWVAHGRI